MSDDNDTAILFIAGAACDEQPSLSPAELRSAEAYINVEVRS